MIKDFFYYTRTERIGILVLIVIVSLCTLFSIFFESNDTSQEKPDRNFEKEYQAFVRSIQILNRKEYYKYYHPPFESAIILASFAPNTDDSLTFMRLGLPKWMVHNIIKYRTKGGKFRKPEDFKKIYGMSLQRFNMLLPYIHIPTSKRDTIRLLASVDSTKRPQYPVKFTTPTKLELNTVDTTALKKIPGIGSGIARMIVRYRTQLGGFHHIKQLEEIHLISSRLVQWFTINPALIHKINVNKAGLSRLNAHPYINFYQAKVIIEHRRKRGALKSLNQLSLYEEFNPSDFERINPYITFD